MEYILFSYSFYVKTSFPNIEPIFLNTIGFKLYISCAYKSKLIQYILGIVDR